MQLVSIKSLIAMLWVSAVSIAAVAGHVNSLLGWTTLSALMVLPPVAMLRLWNEPRQSLSQSIQEALR